MLALAGMACAQASAITFTETGVPLVGSGYGSPAGIAVGDFDEDGGIDVAVSLQSGDLSLMLRNPATGAYAAAPGSPHAVGASDAGPLVAADVDHDGHLDLLAFQAKEDGSTVAVLHGDGHGGLTPAPTVALPGSWGSMAVGDVDGDGNPDIVAALEENPAVDDPGAGPRLAVVRGTSDGTFAAPVIADATPDGLYPSAVALGDFDGDGKLDAAVAHLFTADGIVTVARGDGAGGFTAFDGSPYAIGGGTFDLSAGDLDGDGELDLVTSVSTDGVDNSLTPAVLLGNGDGTFHAGPAGSFATPSTSNSPSAFAFPLGDLDGDGRLDTALPVSESGGVWTLFGDGAGRLLSPSEAPIPSGGYVNSDVIADLDGDGRLDIAAVEVGDPELRIFINDSEPAIAVSTPSLDLGSARVAAPAAVATVRISNPGDHGLLISGLSIGGPAAGDFAATGCTDGPIPAGDHCDVSVTFTPAAAGLRMATLSIASDAPHAPSTTVALSGVGTLPPPPDDGGTGGGDQSGGGDDGAGGGGSGGGDQSGGGNQSGGTGQSGGDQSGGGTTGDQQTGAGGSDRERPGSGAARRSTLRLTIKPVRMSLAPGGKRRVTVTIRNRGTKTARKLRICARKRPRLLRAGRCVRIRALRAHHALRRKITIRLARTAKPHRRLTLTLVARATGVRPTTARAVVKTRRRARSGHHR